MQSIVDPWVGAREPSVTTGIPLGSLCDRRPSKDPTRDRDRFFL
jgi:hypothetical protein